MLLNDIQRRFKETILDHPDVVANPPSDLAAVFEAGDIALADRLKVYRNNIVGSLTDVMVASFPSLEKLVGLEFLEGMARSFILENPPSHGCLSFYGQDFPAFIDGFAPAKGLPYLSDVARLEVALNDAYYAKDDTALSADILARIAPEDLGNIALPLRDCVYLLRSPFPVSDIRDFAMADTQQGALDIDSGAAYLMVYRKHLDTEIIILDEAEYVMLETLQAVTLLGEAVESVLGRFEAFDFQGFLQKHLFLETFLMFNANETVSRDDT